MQTEHLFNVNDVFPSWWPNALGKFLSVMAEAFVLTYTDTTVSVVAGANDLASTIAVEGLWRFNEATVTRSHPGGSAGTYNIFVTAANNSVSGSTDSTNYAFGLAITATTPTIVGGSVDVFRLVGTCTWDGTRITSLTQTVGATPAQQSFPIVTSLPGSPIDGQVVRLLVDATQGIIWTLRYRSESGSSFKWEFLGGNPMVNDQGTGAVGGGSPTSGAYIVYGPSGGTWLTVPRNGKYILEHRVDFNIAATGSGLATVKIIVGGTVVHTPQWFLPANNGWSINVNRKLVLLSLTAGQTITTQAAYAQDAGPGATPLIQLTCGATYLTPVAIS